MIITKSVITKNLSKRRWDSSSVTALESMVPALSNAQDSIKPAQRLFVGYVPNGVIMDKWTRKLRV